MQSYTFSATGHKNITTTHATTLEFTKDNHVTKSGDCILGINATFDLKELKKFLTQKQIHIIIQSENIKETMIAVPNPQFADERELVIRTTDFKSPRTFATHATKAAKDIDRELTKKQKNNNNTLTVTLKRITYK